MRRTVRNVRLSAGRLITRDRQVQDAEVYARQVEEEAERRVQGRLAAEIARLRSELGAEAERRFQEGLRQGREQERDAARREMEAERARLRAFLEDLSSRQEEVLKDAERMVVQLACAVAGKIVRAELRMNPDLVLDAIKASIRHAVDKSKVIVRVHPEDLGTVRERREELLAVVEGIERLEIQEDEGILRGGCVVETNFETIDARADEELAKIERALLGGSEHG